MSSTPSIPAELLEGRHSVQTASTGETVHVFATASAPAFPSSESRSFAADSNAKSTYPVDVSFPIWGVTFLLKGGIDLSDLSITSLFSVVIPLAGTFALTNVNGSLQTGVSVPFINNAVNGNAKFYLTDGWLTVDIAATVLKIPHTSATFKLIPLPL